MKVIIGIITSVIICICIILIFTKKESNHIFISKSEWVMEDKEYLKSDVYTHPEDPIPWFINRQTRITKYHSGKKEAVESLGQIKDTSRAGLIVYFVADFKSAIPKLLAVKISSTISDVALYFTFDISEDLDINSYNVDTDLILTNILEKNEFPERISQVSILNGSGTHRKLDALFKQALRMAK